MGAGLLATVIGVGFASSANAQYWYDRYYANPYVSPWTYRSFSNPVVIDRSGYYDPYYGYNPYIYNRRGVFLNTPLGQFNIPF